MRVTVRKRGPGGSDDEDIDWPSGWPLPSEGTIFLGEVVGGWVDHIEFDLPAQRILVVLR